MGKFSWLRKTPLQSNYQSKYKTYIGQKLNKTLKDRSFCHYCGVSLNANNGTSDHKQPLSKGGTNKRSNIISCCYSCNQRKSNMTYEEFVKAISDGTIRLAVNE